MGLKGEEEKQAQLDLGIEEADTEDFFIIGWPRSI